MSQKFLTQNCNSRLRKQIRDHELLWFHQAKWKVKIKLFKSIWTRTRFHIEQSWGQQQKWATYVITKYLFISVTIMLYLLLSCAPWFCRLDFKDKMNHIDLCRLNLKNFRIENAISNTVTHVNCVPFKIWVC